MYFFFFLLLELDAEGSLNCEAVGDSVEVRRTSRQPERFLLHPDLDEILF